MGIYSCNQCNKTFSHETNLMRHIQGFHENKILECEVCGFKTPRKDTLKSHKVAKHGNANKPNLISINPSSSVTEVANTGAYGGQTYHQPMVNSLTQPNLMYNHVQTQTIGDKKTTYRDAGIQAHPKQKDVYAQSEFSDDSSQEVDFKRDSFYTNSKKLLNKGLYLMNELVKTNVEWKHLISLMIKESYFQKKNKFEISEIMDLVAYFDGKLQSTNDLHNYRGYNGNEKNSQDSNFDEGSEQDSDVNGSQDSMKETSDSEEEEPVIDHGPTCFKDMVYEFEKTVKDIPWTQQLYGQIQKKTRVENSLDKKESQSSEDIDESDRERTIKEETISIDKIKKLRVSLDKFLEGVNLEGNHYIKNCPVKEIKHVGKCCNMFLFSNLPIGDSKMKEIRDNFLDDKIYPLADSLVSVKDKRKILRNGQNGEGLLHVLTHAILPSIKAILLNQ